MGRTKQNRDADEQMGGTKHNSDADKYMVGSGATMMLMGTVDW